MLFKLSNLNSNLALTLGYLNSAFNNSALVDKFTKRSSIHARHTRKRHLLRMPLYRTATGQRTFAYGGTSIWNNLDNDIKQCVSLQSFKQAIKGQLLEQVFSYVFCFYEFLFSYIHYLYLK